MPVPNTEENRKACLCYQCPTYMPVQGDKGFYCSLDKSDKQMTRKGCLCPNCSVWVQYGLGSVYYCFIGKAK